MGFLIKAEHVHSNGLLLHSSQVSCSFGLDCRGIPAFKNENNQIYLNLFDLEQNDENNLCIKARNLELRTSRAAFIGISTEIQFSDCLRLFWRDIQFDISYISTTAFLMAKLGRPDLLGAYATHCLECKEIGLKVPIFKGVNLTIGTHIKDSISISESLIKARHAQIKFEKDRSEPEVFAHFGQVESFKNSNAIVFKMLPCDIEFQLTPAC